MQQPTATKPTFTVKNPIPNPYARRPQNGTEMGRQSQQRISNQHTRKYKLASTVKRRRKGDQLTLDNQVAFQAERDCVICRARATAKFVEGYRVPKRAHHPLCLLNTKTKGLGKLSVQSVANLEDNKRYKALTRPIQPEERGSWKYSTKEAGAAFFAPRKRKAAPAMTNNESEKEPTAMPQQQQQQQLQDKGEESVTPLELSKAVCQLVNDTDFIERHKSKGAPLAMLAFAEQVTEKIIRRKDSFGWFNGLELEVPRCHEDDNPHYHSIVGQKLLLVDWERMFGVLVPCPDPKCSGTLKNDRTNFSKNKTLFPIFGLDGAPAWCIVMVLKCPCCKRRFNSNEGDVLVNIPEYAADAYPVETTYALANSTYHLSRNAAEVFSSIMVTYGNGELCSKLLFNAINRDYMRRLKVYYSMAKERKEGTRTERYVDKDGTFIKQYPPLGDNLRDLYDAAAASSKNPWCISDNNRNTREIQSVKCNGIFAQDHTFEVIKNYQKRLGAKAAWDVATETGEIASAVLVSSSKTEDFAHAAQQLMKRPTFNPKVMYSDTWPNKKEYWYHVCPGLEGRLGLFHYQKRIISTLRKKHVDYFDAVTDLLAALYAYCPEDYEKLLSVLKDGSLSRTGKKYSSREITDMKSSRVFRDRYSKYLRKQMHRHETIVQMLDDWFCRYKVTSSDPENHPAGGRLDPIRMQSLFTADTKSAVENCKEKACYLSDPLPLKEMYNEILPNPNSRHQLTEYLSLRGESKLEAFHDRFAHFANCGMRDSLADSLNLAGTARYNLAIRHKRMLVKTVDQADDGNSLANPEQRRNIPAGWEKVVPFYNHSELWHINKMAAAVGCSHPFPYAEVLPEDNGERFFSEYLTITVPSLKGTGHGELGECLCCFCSATTGVVTIPAPPRPMTTTTSVTTENLVTTTATATMPSIRKSRQSQTAQRPTYNIINTAFGAPIASIAPLIPMQYQMPMFCVPPPCCLKYAEWLQRRRGRPPHHPLCPCR